MRVVIIGQGYVGLTISAFAAELHEVIGFDMNTAVVERLNKSSTGKPVIYILILKKL